MIPVSGAASSRALDRATIDGLGLPGIALMELASAAAAKVVRDAYVDGSILVLCGPGNNGGDGWGVARWLHGWGLPVAVWSIPGSGEGDAGIMADVARKAGVREVSCVGEPSLVVDALFGTGLTRPIGGPGLQAVEALAGCRTVAIDMPSGLHSDTGEAMGPVLIAESTVTFGRAKLGMFLQSGPRVCGRVVVVDIGLDAGTPPTQLADAYLLQASDLRWPTRERDVYKHRLGHLLVVAGSAQMAGAAVLCCRGALAAGTGLVTLLAPRGAWHRLAMLPPEVMLIEGGKGDQLSTLPEPHHGVTAIAAGPGLGGGGSLAPELLQALTRWWLHQDLPLVYDADALVATTATTQAERVLTPHEGEAARLLQRTSAEVRRNRLLSVQSLATRGVAVLKGPHSLVCGGEVTTINPTGGPVLACAGSGDVLTGFIGGLLARGCPAVDAARAAVWAHGRAGDQLAATRADGWTASDIAERLSATSSDT